jgi:hypothetical protein
MVMAVRAPKVGKVTIRQLVRDSLRAILQAMQVFALVMLLIMLFTYLGLGLLWHEYMKLPDSSWPSMTNSASKLSQANFHLSRAVDSLKGAIKGKTKDSKPEDIIKEAKVDITRAQLLTGIAAGTTTDNRAATPLHSHKGTNQSNEGK